MQSLHVASRSGQLHFVSRNCYESRGQSTAQMIEDAAAGLRLRDCEFLVNTADEPGAIEGFPTFSYSTATDDYAWVCPDFLFGGWPEVQINHYDTLCASLAAAGRDAPLSGRTGWIGVPMVPARERLVMLGRVLPHALEAVPMQWNRDDPKRLKSATFLTLEDQVRRWKYLIDVEGCGWSARFKAQLWSGRVTFLADRPWKEWFFPQLEPWRHYVPLRRDLADFPEHHHRIESDPALQATIAREAQAFARAHLSRAAAVRRWRELLEANFAALPRKTQPRAETPARPVPAPGPIASSPPPAPEGPLQRIIVIPAGRRRYLEILFAHLLAQKADFDELHLWLNTTDEEDLAYCADLAARHPWVKAVAARIPVNGVLSIHHFFAQCVDPRAHYLRLDDDIVYLEPRYVARTFAFRAAHPEYFLVFGNIINNAIVTHLHQRLGHIHTDRTVGYACLDDVGWKEGAFAEELHREFLASLAADDVGRWHFDRWILDRHEWVSINSICWRGADFALFAGRVGRTEERWLTVLYPGAARKCSVIYGGAVCAHFAFGPQREHLDPTDLLGQYAALAPAALEPALACSPS